MNRIPEIQNENSQVERLAAQRHLYGRAKLAVGAQLTLATVPALVFSLLMLHLPGLKIWATLSSLGITLLDFGLIDPLHRSWRKIAAQIQEAFDCDVLSLDWTSLRAGKQPPPEEIMRYAAPIWNNKEKIDRLRDWYPTSVGQLPLELGRLVCQRTNCQWDATLRATYSKCLVVSLWTVAITIFVLGTIANPTFDGFVLAMLAPATPAMLLALRQYREYADAARSSEQLREHVDNLWARAMSKDLELPALTPESRALQSEIFLRRATASPVFNWLYNRLAKQQQTFADRGAEQLVTEAKQKSSLS